MSPLASGAVQKWWRGLGLVILAVVVAWPAWRQPPTDGFPLSTYPMFASNRGRLSVVPTAVGLTERGERLRLSPQLLAGTDEPLVAIAAARSAIANQPQAWCGEVARRVSADATHRARGVTHIEVVVETHDAVAYFAHDAPPERVEVRATCPVEG